MDQVDAPPPHDREDEFQVWPTGGLVEEEPHASRMANGGNEDACRAMRAGLDHAWHGRPRIIDHGDPIREDRVAERRNAD